VQAALLLLSASARGFPVSEDFQAEKSPFFASCQGAGHLNAALTTLELGENGS
jgi:hypothetical protein